MNGVKVIETEYKGFKFRSRLEARWAVFFDTLGVKWRYETEGFEKESGERYLPDFYLPDFDVYCEVKPNDRTRANEIRKACSFADGVHIRALLILPDIPYTDALDKVFWYKIAYYDNLRKAVAIERAALMTTDNDEYGFNILVDRWVGRKEIEWMWYPRAIESWDALHDSEMPYTRDYELRYILREFDQDHCAMDGIERIALAYQKARAARFDNKGDY